MTASQELDPAAAHANLHLCPVETDSSIKIAFAETHLKAYVGICSLRISYTRLDGVSEGQTQRSRHTFPGSSYHDGKLSPSQPRGRPGSSSRKAKVAPDLLWCTRTTVHWQFYHTNDSPKHNNGPDIAGGWVECWTRNGKDWYKPL